MIRRSKGVEVAVRYSPVADGGSHTREKQHFSTVLFGASSGMGSWLLANAIGCGVWSVEEGDLGA